MSDDPKRESPPAADRPEDPPTEDRSGAGGADNAGGIEANRPNPDVPLIESDAD